MLDRINHVIIRRPKKEVLFHILRVQEFHFFGVKFKSLPCLVSSLQTEKMQRKESCQGFLVSIIGSQYTKAIFNDINIVRDFVVLFLEDLLGIPQNRQVKFTIDLFSETQYLRPRIEWRRKNFKN